MKSEILNELGIYVIRYKGIDYLYAPLSGILAESNIAEVESLCASLDRGDMPSEFADMYNMPGPELPLTPDTLPEITILINQKCNFACRYCYSANGRNSAELEEAFFDPIVDWFVTPERLAKSNADRLSVTFSGGGDPMLSFGKVKMLIEKFRLRANLFGITLDIGLVCNGSLLESDDLNFLADNVDNIVISFDVLEDVHDAQRSHYSTVAQTIREFCARNIDVGLRATITELNVTRMVEMVEILASSFQQCRRIAMEAVLAPDLWNDVSALHKFYTCFVDNYFQAKRFGEELGISVCNTLELSAEGIKSRACPGKISISPDGVLTACSRVATSGDRFFERFIFGKVNKDGVNTDIQCYTKIMNVRADNIKKCHNCFARYHCGGGCMLVRLSYNDEQMEEYCNFTRAMLLNTIMYELD